jgi:hypothetical protein
VPAQALVQAEQGVVLMVGEVFALVQMPVRVLVLLCGRGALVRDVQSALP